MIYTLFLMIWLDSNTIHVADKTYHDTQQECMESANVIIRQYALEYGPVKYMTVCRSNWEI